MKCTEGESRIPVHRPMYRNPVDNRDEQGGNHIGLGAQRAGSGIKWIKAGDFDGVLVHDKHSGVLLRDAWANDWREQGYRRSQGDRSTMVLVNNMRLLATYQHLWNCENEEFLVFREELDSMRRKVSRKEVQLIGGDFN